MASLSSIDDCRVARRNYTKAGVGAQLIVLIYTVFIARHYGISGFDKYMVYNEGFLVSGSRGGVGRPRCLGLD